jgi:hypothetical protein
MKTTIICLLSVFSLAFAEPAKPVGDLKGGRMLEAAGLRAEFFIQADRRATVTFVDAAGKAVPSAGRIVTVKVDGKDAVLEAQPNGGARPVNFRITLNTAHCGGCKRAEYGCTCDH